MGRASRPLLVASLVILAGLFAACGGDEVVLPGIAAAPSGEITVFAAASLTEAFKEIALVFEEDYPGAKVIFNFAGTPTLRTQLEQGARADVFASANREQMDLARESGIVEATSSTFARNALAIITPSDNPAAIESAADLAREGLKLVVAQEDVPVGAYTRQALQAMSADPAFSPG